MTRRVGIALSTALLTVVAGIAAQAESHVRIVRLSYTDGHVEMDRNGQGVERAILNAPIVEGTRIVTGSDGLAEVEFENQSALRVAENSEVKFRRLVINDAGNKVNEIDVVKGTVYVDTQKGDDIYRLIANDKSFLVPQHTEARLMADSGQLTLAVFKGDVQVENQPQTLVVKKKETLSLAADNSTNLAVKQGIDSTATDVWNEERAAYANTYARNNNSFNTGAARGYGLQDLNYYGSFFYAPGYGYAWQPYGLASFAGWNPFMMGAWLYNPGLGYSFASPYAWGWLPYHYGSWAYLPNSGWAWLPGNGSAYKGNTLSQSFQPVTAVTRAPANYAAPVPPAGTLTHVYGPLGNMQAYIPGGRVNPNFRSVIDSSAAGHSAPIKPGATFAAANSNQPGASNAAASMRNASHPNNGHVFLPPPHSQTATPDWANAEPGLERAGMAGPGASNLGVAGAHGGPGGSHTGTTHSGGSGHGGTLGH